MNLEQNCIFHTYIYACLCVFFGCAHFHVSPGTIPQSSLESATDGCGAAASAGPEEPLGSDQSGAPQGPHTAGLLPLCTGRVQGKHELTDV